jgi:hypothetical protein
MVFLQMWRLGVIDGSIAFQCNENFSVISTALDPIIIFSPVNKVIIDNDDITIVTSNVLLGSTSSISMAFSLVDQVLQTRYDSRNENAFLFPLPILIAAPAQTSKWV